MIAAILGAPRWVKGAGLAVLAAIVLLGLWLWIGAREEADDKANQEIGATAQREGDLREVVKRTEEGNAARNEINDAGSTAKYDQCVRSARTPANCKRFLPERPTDHD